MKSGRGGLVYSTEGGRMCPRCRRPLVQCACRAAAAPISGGPVRVERSSKGRGGKMVTMVRGLSLDAEALSLLGKRLRTACGSGGTVKDGVVEVQGDHVERVLGLLQAEGLPAKRSGG